MGVAKFNQRDFMIGAALFALLQHNADAKPSLLETTDYSAYFKVATNTTDDFGIYIKFAKSPIREGTWAINLTATDKKRISDMYIELPTSYILIVLGEEYKTGDVMVLLKSEYEKIAHKASITVKLSSPVRPKEFHIPDGAGIALKVKRNRIEKRLVGLVEAPEDYECEMGIGM